MRLGDRLKKVDGEPEELDQEGPVQRTDPYARLKHQVSGALMERLAARPSNREVTDDELLDPEVTTLDLADGAAASAGTATFTGAVTCARPGRYGFTVRVAPHHPNLSTPLELGRLTWA